jgi:uncharacterized protein YbjT (DUF2867 family)
MGLLAALGAVDQLLIGEEGLGVRIGLDLAAMIVGFKVLILARAAASNLIKLRRPPRAVSLVIALPYADVLARIEGKSLRTTVMDKYIK